MIPVSEPNADQLFVVGSYTTPYGPFRAIGEGVSLMRLSSDGEISLVDRLALPNPAYLRPDGQGRVYAVLETDDARAGIAAIALDGDALRLRLEQSIASPGAIPCHLDIHPGGGWLACACYGSGHVFTRRILAGGRLADGGTVIRRQGSSVNPQRQNAAHPHAARFSPDGKWLAVPDLGTDEIACYPFDATGGALAGESARLWKSPPGSGPRLVLFSPDGQYLLAIKEIASEISSLTWKTGRLEEVCSVSCLTGGFSGANTTAGLRWHPDGRTFAVSNRGANTIALFRFDAGDGRVAPLGAVPSGGVKPRDFDFTPCGRWLIAANQDGDSLVVFAVEPDRLAASGIRHAVRSPSCVRMLP